ncbi:MAG: hypothetical protein IJL76_01155 [Bacilli bacterium]|nr:hypothetical protein [Bacilli bacterium]
MSDKSIDKLNEQIKKLSNDQYEEDKSFDDVKLKVIKAVPKEDVDKTIKLEKIDESEVVEKTPPKKEEITRKIKLEDTKEMSKKEIESLTKKIDKMKDTEEYTFDTTTGIFSNEMDEPLIKKAVLVGIGIFTVLVLLIIIVIIL